MDTSYSSNSYSSDAMQAYRDYLQRLQITIFISLLVQVVGAAIIYGLIKCCCPTSLRSVRPGFILSGDTVSTVQPIAVQNRVPMETNQLRAYQPMSQPPEYSECMSDDLHQLALTPKI